jgi:2-polyprenyl-3-methyl-5-hydroxy-6-metoxy-1,4-benzoquinol methylase
MKQILAGFITFLIILNVLSCRQHQNHQEREHHPDATHANEHMHQADFELLLKQFEDPQRAAWQKPEQVIALLGDLSGKTIADIGAGSGYFDFPLAEKAEKVIAIDIDRRFLDYIEDKNNALPQKLPIETRLAEEDDPHLAYGEADMVIIVNTYHHIENRPDYFNDVRKKLKPNGSLIVVDFFKREAPVGPPVEMKLSGETVTGELRKAGFEDLSLDTNTLPYQYIIIAKLLK